MGISVVYGACGGYILKNIFAQVIIVCLREKHVIIESIVKFCVVIYSFSSALLRLRIQATHTDAHTAQPNQRNGYIKVFKFNGISSLKLWFPYFNIKRGITGSKKCHKEDILLNSVFKLYTMA